MNHIGMSAVSITNIVWGRFKSYKSVTTHVLVLVQVVCIALGHYSHDPILQYTLSPKYYYNKLPLDLQWGPYHQPDELLLCRNHLEHITPYRRTCSHCHTELHSGATR